MKRRGLMVLTLVFLATLSGAGGPVSAPVPAERLRQFQQDQTLIDALVDGGLDLADEDDPLQRADRCRRLAEVLTRAIRKAGAAKDTPRVARLSQHLEAMLDSGVAGNLDQARKLMPSGSSQARKFRLVGDQVKEMEAELGQATDLGAEQKRPVLNAFSQGRKKVEEAIRGPFGTSEKRSGK